jgi:hypothetical protein
MSRRFVSLTLSGLFLAACGGGGEGGFIEPTPPPGGGFGVGGGGTAAPPPSSGTPPPPTVTPPPPSGVAPAPAPATIPPNEAEGRYDGQFAISPATTFVLDDGRVFSFYYADLNKFVLTGVVQGSTLASGGALTSNDARDFDYTNNVVRNVGFGGTYVVAGPLNVTVSYTSPTSSALLTGQATQSFFETARLVDAVNVYTGDVHFGAGREAAITRVFANGDINGSGASCSYSGLFLPRSRGNLYDVDLRLDGPNCASRGITVRGVGYLEQRVLRMFLIDGTRDHAVAMVVNLPGI